jgi:hypothetical protein
MSQMSADPGGVLLQRDAPPPRRDRRGVIALVLIGVGLLLFALIQISRGSDDEGFDGPAEVSATQPNSSTTGQPAPDTTVVSEGAGRLPPIADSTIPSATTAIPGTVPPADLEAALADPNFFVAWLPELRSKPAPDWVQLPRPARALVHLGHLTLGDPRDRRKEPEEFPLPQGTPIPMRIEHSIEIDAPVERVWGLTIDVESWPGFTPTMESVERLNSEPLAVGSRVRVKQPQSLPRAKGRYLIDGADSGLPPGGRSKESAA